MDSVVVGVAATVQIQGYALRPRHVQAYWSARQMPPRGYWILVRTEQEPAALAQDLRRAVTQVDRNQPVFDLRTYDTRVSETVAAPRLYAFLLAAFSSLAILLTAVGLYGALAFQVASRRRDFGIRMALGARPAVVLRQVLGRGMLLVACGLCCGLAAAFFLTRILSALLFGVTPADPMTFVLVSVLLGVVALLAAHLPARRATKVDPMVTLRAE